MVVDVVNRIPGQSFGIHWRGQYQKETPHMDGVPMITQCPIPSFTTFQYKFRASNPGTHMWQVNTGEEALETQFGGFVVRQPDSRDPQKHLYDTDSTFHVITVHSWSPQRKSPFLDDSRSKLFINGKIEVKKLLSNKKSGTYWRKIIICFQNTPTNSMGDSCCRCQWHFLPF